MRIVYLERLPTWIASIAAAAASSASWYQTQSNGGQVPATGSARRKLNRDGSHVARWPIKNWEARRRAL